MVEALGPGVDAEATGLRPGRLVALSWIVPCGACRSCRAGRVWECAASPSFEHGRVEGRTRLHRADGSDVLAYLSIGTMAEAQVVPAAAAVPLPPDTPAPVAALSRLLRGDGCRRRPQDGRGARRCQRRGDRAGRSGPLGRDGGAAPGAGPIVAVDRVAAKLDLARVLAPPETVSSQETIRSPAPVPSAT